MSISPVYRNVFPDLAQEEGKSDLTVRLTSPPYYDGNNPSRPSQALRYFSTSAFLAGATQSIQVVPTGLYDTVCVCVTQMNALPGPPFGVYLSHDKIRDRSSVGGMPSGGTSALTPVRAEQSKPNGITYFEWELPLTNLVCLVWLGDDIVVPSNLPLVTVTLKTVRH